MEFNLGRRTYETGWENPQQICESEVIDENKVERAEENQKNMEAKKDPHEEVYKESKGEIAEKPEMEETNKGEEKKEAKDRGILELLDELIRIYKNR